MGTVQSSCNGNKLTPAYFKLHRVEHSYILGSSRLDDTKQLISLQVPYKHFTGQAT
jgi:hypothetical protein